MTSFQKIIKYIAIAIAIFLAVSIVGGALSMLGLFGNFFGGDAVTKDATTYDVSSDINTLKVEINAADFQVKQGETFSVESNLKHLTVNDKNGVLTIKETKKFSGKYTNAILILYIPAETKFENVNLTTGAGRLTIDKLSADTLDFELGAGEVFITHLIATLSADIEGGAGKITVSDGTVNNLDLQMGVGQLNLISALTGECELDLGVGESNITVLGNKDDYKLDIEKGIGNITVNGSSISNIKGHGNSKDSIEITGGIGAINVKFEENKNLKTNELFDITTEPISSEALKIVIEKETYSIEDKVIKYSITNTSDFEQSIAGDDDCFSLQILVDGEWKRIGTKKEHYWNSLGLILPSGETEQREIDLDEYFNLPLEKGTYRIAVENLASNTIKIS